MYELIGAGRPRSVSLCILTGFSYDLQLLQQDAPFMVGVVGVLNFPVGIKITI